MITVNVDFNDLGYGWGYLLSCYPEHCSGELVKDEQVILTDGELQCRGIVVGFENHGRGDLVQVIIIPDTWVDLC